MYQVIFKSSGVVAFRSSLRRLAQEWLNDNNFCPRSGKCLDLFAMKKV